MSIFARLVTRSVAVGSRQYTAKKAALPLFTAGHQAGLTFWKLGATTRESVCVLQVKKSLEQPAEQCGLVTGLSQMPMGIASLNAVGSYPTALSPSSWLAESQFCSGSNVLSSHEWIVFGQILSWQLQFPFALGWSRGGQCDPALASEMQGQRRCLRGRGVILPASSYLEHCYVWTLCLELCFFWLASTRQHLKTNAIFPGWQEWKHRKSLGPWFCWVSQCITPGTAHLMTNDGRKLNIFIVKPLLEELFYYLKLKAFLTNTVL